MSSQMVSLDQPPALVQGGAADQAHGAVDDDGVDLVALDHADVEEAGILAVHDVVQRAALAVAVVLRRLDEADLGVGEGGHEIGEPVRGHGVIGIDDADDLGVGGGLRHGEPQRAGLVAVEPRRVDEAEALAERAAVLLDRLPHRRARRVVDDDDALEIRIIEPSDRIERRLEHVRRLHVGGDVDRHLWARIPAAAAPALPDASRRCGARPNHTTAISSIRRSVITTSGTSSSMPSASAKAEPNTK